MINELEQNFHRIQQRISDACHEAGRDVEEVQLVAVSKTKPSLLISEAANLGMKHFGENYLQEATGKIHGLQPKPGDWHYIGKVQSNKTRDIAEHFDWVHTVDREKIALRLNAHRTDRPKLNVLVQVNVDNDPDKGGCSGDQALTLCRAICDLPNLRLRGLMTILSQETNPREGYESVAQLHREIGTQLAEPHRDSWDALSMGMSRDLEDAIFAGATLIRVGTALFGERR